MVRVSVVIPTFNAARFIGRTLASVFSQALLPHEVIVVDDCSTDDTAAIVERIATTATTPLRLLKSQKNSGGPATPLNIGVKASTGDLIATLDHDDQMTPNRLADQVRAFSAQPELGLVLGRVRCRTGEGPRSAIPELGWRVLQELTQQEISPGVYRIPSADAWRGALNHGCFAMTCSAFMFPKKVWATVGGFDWRVRTNCDYAFLAWVSRWYDVAYVSSVVADWSWRDDTLYSGAGLVRRLEDQWIVLAGFQSSAMARADRRQWRRVLRDFLFDSGYELRKASAFRAAGRFYLRSLAWGCPDRRLPSAVLKTVAAAMRSVFFH